MLAPTLGLAAMAVGIATTWLMVSGPTVERDPDARFWYGFCGLSVLAPLVLGAVLLDPWAGVAMLAIVSAVCLATCRYLGHEADRRADADARSRLAAERSDLEARHDQVLRAWSRYEVDPMAAIEHPGMNDVHVPQTALVARALARAERLRGRWPDPADPEAETGYLQSVIALESAFRRAEQSSASAPGRKAGGR